MMIKHLAFAAAAAALVASFSGCANQSPGGEALPMTAAIGSTGNGLRIRQFSDLPSYPAFYFPLALTTGPDDALWVADDIDQDAGANAVVRITASGKNTATYYYQADASPAFADIASGSDGALWITDSAESQILRMTTSGTFTAFPQKGSPEGIVSGPDGALWFVENFFNASAVCRITTQGSVQTFDVGSGAALQDIAVGSDGALWFTEFIAGRIGRITTAGKIKEFSRGITTGSQPYSIVAGPDGALWFTELKGGKIGRITTKGHVTEYSHGITAGEQPIDLTAGSDNAIWFTEYEGPYQYEHQARIGRITTSGQISEYAKGLDRKSEPTGIALGPDGKVWFVETRSNRLGRVDP